MRPLGLTSRTGVLALSRTNEVTEKSTNIPSRTLGGARDPNPGGDPLGGSLMGEGNSNVRDISESGRSAHADSLPGCPPKSWELVVVDGQEQWTTVVSRGSAKSIRRHCRKAGGVRPTTNEIRGRAAKSMGRAILCWGSKDTSIKTFWQRLARACNGGTIVERILKVERVVQADRSIRFDTYCQKGDVRTVLRMMRGYAKKFRWYLRADLPAREREIAQNRERRRAQKQGAAGVNGFVKGTEPETEPVPSKWLKVGTLNVNGIKDKKLEVQHLLESENLGCLALQETRVMATDWELTMPGYNVFSMCGNKGASTRGVALLLKKTLSGYVVGKSSSWHVAVRCFGGPLALPWLLVSVYLPSKNEPAKEPLAVVLRELEKIRTAFPDDSIMIMGDFNRKRDEVAAIVNKAIPGVKVHEPTNPREIGTRRQGSRRIDHLVSRATQGSYIQEPSIRMKEDISDHYPVIGKIRTKQERGAVPVIPMSKERPPRMDSTKIPVCTGRRGEGEDRSRMDQVITSNRWLPLLELESKDVEDMGEEEAQVRVDEVTERLIEISHEVAKDVGMDKEPPTGMKPGVQRKVASALNRRKRARCRAMLTKPGSAENHKAWEASRAVDKAAQQVVREYTRKRWRRTLDKAAEDMQRDPRTYWKWLSATAGWKTRDTAVGGAQPVKHPRTGDLLTDPNGINEAWGLHYGALAEDKTGNSRNPRKWERWRAHPQRRHLVDLDSDIDSEEMMEALKRLKRHKAPGSDGIPADFFKLAIGKTGSSRLFRVLLKIINLMWRGRTIPKAWQDSTVVSIPKKGDVTDMNNYRGISLMGTGLKLLMTITSLRLNGAFEQAKLFTPAQAGFRKNEECVTQIACLMEIVKRREFSGRPTYLMFVDLKKAYDTVPQEALLAKLDFYGVRGRMLGFIRSLYRNTKITVRSGEQTSAPVQLERGVRQGCPLSPVLFNIFINDILDGGSEFGVTVPGLDPETHVPGLLFADDLVALCPTPRRLERMAGVLSEWMGDNEMGAGIHKCGIMVVGAPMGTLSNTPTRWCIQGAPVPIVDTYKYLGLDFRADMDVDKMLTERLASGRRLIDRLYPFLHCKTIPLPMKLTVIRGVVLPSLLFGCEVYGMRKCITAGVQVTLNRALKLAIGVGQKAPASNVALWRETGIQPVCATAAGQRGRAYQKCKGLATWVQQLVTHDAERSRKWTWASGTVKWINRYVAGFVKDKRSQAPDSFKTKGGWKEMGPEQLSGALVAAVWSREENRLPSKAGARYLKARFYRTPLNKVRGGVCPELTIGMAALIRCRMGTLWEAVSLAKIGRLPRKFLKWCPCCRTEVPETLEHLMLDCQRWSGVRERTLSGIVVEAKNLLGTQLENVSQACVTLLLGGESQGKRLENWGFEYVHESTSVIPTLGAVDEPQETGLPAATSRVRKPGCLLVSAYLASVVEARAPIIGALGSQAPKPVPTADQS